MTINLRFWKWDKRAWDTCVGAGVAIALLAMVLSVVFGWTGCAPRSGFFGLGGSGSGGKPSGGAATFCAERELDGGADSLTAGMDGGDQRPVGDRGLVAMEGTESDSVPDRIGGDPDATATDRRLGGVVHYPGRVPQRSVADAASVGKVEADENGARMLIVPQSPDPRLIAGTVVSFCALIGCLAWLEDSRIKRRMKGAAA